MHIDDGKFYISAEEYQQKRYEISREILSNAIAKTELQNGDGIAKLNESFIFNSILVADNLLEELKYAVEPKKIGQDETSIRTLSSILKNSKDQK